ncbi:helix-turn-helix domain-containing protein [Sporohalobacter salinus]|uniref:helix-turn-helix domain-containing protein n=1 Tax=Sporohalobacter salinus TaxID=1494606 RepID=UPI001961A7CB|nr:helix-turn-helix transcriptional regulator [Sporohalobacter salinus]MBM7622997.1 transcriptional regulator with XRE-family HTH domain [Sporohalobacter salinus]
MEANDRIRNLREKENLTRKELAKLIGYSEDYIYKIETGKREVSKAFLDTISRAFNIPRSYFFKDDELKYNQKTDNLDFEELIMENNINFYGEKLDKETKKNIIKLVKTAIKLKDK